MRCMLTITSRLAKPDDVFALDMITGWNRCGSMATDKIIDFDVGQFPSYSNAFSLTRSYSTHNICFFLPHPNHYHKYISNRRILYPKPCTTALLSPQLPTSEGKRIGIAKVIKMKKTPNSIKLWRCPKATHSRKKEKLNDKSVLR